MFAIEAGQGCLPCGRRIVYQDNIKDHYGEPPDQGQLGKLNMWPMPQYPTTSQRASPHMLFISTSQMDIFLCARYISSTQHIGWLIIWQAPPFLNMLHSGSNIVLLGQLRLILINLKVITSSWTDVALEVDWIGWVGSCIDLFTLLISANIVKNVKVSKTVKISKM